MGAGLQQGSQHAGSEESIAILMKLICENDVYDAVLAVVVCSLWLQTRVILGCERRRVPACDVNVHSRHTDVLQIT